MNEWKIVSLESIVDVTMGQSPKSKFYNEEMIGLPFLQGNKTFGDKYPSFEIYTSHVTKKAIKNDVLMSVRAPVGDLNIAPEDICIGRGVCALNMKNGDNEFLYYLLKANISRLINRESGTVFGSVNKKDIETLEVSIPEDKKVQEKILYLLKSVDEKIITNKKINHNLERTLMLLYNSYFEQFYHYDKSKGMKDTEDFGEIPCSWSVEMLEDYVDFIRGVEPGSKNYQETNTGNLIPFIRVGDLGSRDNMVFIEETLSKNKIIYPEDIVVSMDATIGIVKMGLFGAYSSGMRKLVIKDNKINKPFLFCLINSLRIQRIINIYASGTTILHAGKSIKHMNFVLPDLNLMNKFNVIGKPILSKILNNIKETEELVNLRDSLLPKLMFGEIDVSSFEF